MPQLKDEARGFLNRHILRKPKRRTEGTPSQPGGLPPGNVQSVARSTTASAAEHGARSTAPATEVVYFNAAPVPRVRQENAQTLNQAIQNNADSGEWRSHVQPDIRNAEAVTMTPAVAVINPNPGDNYQNLEENAIRVGAVAPGGAPPHSEDSGEANPSDISSMPSTYDEYRALRQRVDQRLAHLRTFSSVADWDARFASAVEGATESDDDRTQHAISKLEELDRELSDADDANKTDEATVRLRRVEATLYREIADFSLLTEEAAKLFGERYDAIQNKILVNSAAPLEEIEALQKDLDAELTKRRYVLSSQMVEMDVLKPLVDRAISIADGNDDQDTKSELTAAWSEIESDALKAEERDRKLEELRALAAELIKTRSIDTKLEEQKRRLPVDPRLLKEGKHLGGGNFGEVMTLEGSAYPPLVGKRAKKEGEIEREAAVYAQLAEHPNIAKCYGIHAIGGKDTLVMENVQGGDITEVLEGLRWRFRDVAREREVVDPKDPERKRRIVVPVRKDPISRAEYLGSIQHILKGILQGLAHFQSLGIVHKDVKGDNIRFDPRTLQPKLVDMGLAQQEGPQEVKEHAIRITPPEHFARQADTESTVKPVWDSFSLGAVLFPLLEQDAPHEAKPEPAEIYQFLAGNPEAEKARLNQGIYVTPTKSNQDVATLAASAMKWDPATGQVTAKRNPDGKPAWQALSPTPTPGTAAPGFYGVMTTYVDFMNGLTHPDPAQRLSPIEALKHPFMTERLLEESQLATILKRPNDALPQEVEPAPTAYADPLAPNPTLYFRLNSQSGLNYRVDSKDPGSPWARVEQFCAYLAAEWISTGCPAQGLRFDGLPSRHDAVSTVIQWSGKGGLGAQASFAAKRIGGQKTASATVLNDARLERYGPGTVLWFGTAAHVWAAAVQPDGSYLVYDPNTGKTTKSTAAQFATNEHGANVFVVRIAATTGSRASATDSPTPAPAPSPQQHRAMAAIEFAIATVRAAYDKDASLLSGASISQLEETGKARGSNLQRVVDTMRRVQQLHAELRTAPTKYAEFNTALHELRSQADHYLLEHPRPVSSDGKARKKACEAIGNCVAALEGSLKTARDQVWVVTEVIRGLPPDQRGGNLVEAYNDLLEEPYTPADIREDKAYWTL